MLEEGSGYHTQRCICHPATSRQLQGKLRPPVTHQGTCSILPVSAGNTLGLGRKGPGSELSICKRRCQEVMPRPAPPLRLESLLHFELLPARAHPEYSLYADLPWLRPYYLPEAPSQRWQGRHQGHISFPSVPKPIISPPPPQPEMPRNKLRHSPRGKGKARAQGTAWSSLATGLQGLLHKHRHTLTS